MRARCVVLATCWALLLTLDAAAQTVSVLANISPGVGSSNPNNLFVAGSDLCFLAQSVGGNTELWCSNGTEAGTRTVTDTLPGGAFGSVQGVGAAGGTSFVSAARSGFDIELYVVTASDVASVIDLNPTGDSTPQNLFTYGNILLFSADDGVNGRELWRSDGTPGGTFMIADINPGVGSSDPSDFGLVGGEVFFGAVDGPGGVELWKTDGTQVGTVLVLDLPFSGSGTGVHDIVDLAGIAIFASAVVTAPGVYRSDGTTGGTVSILSSSSVPAYLRTIGSVVYFAATDGNGTEPWLTDGQPSGTMLIKDIVPGGGIWSSIPGPFTELGNLVLFPARGALGSDVELWRTEGTAITTERVFSVNPFGDDLVSNLRALGNKVYFSANDGVTGIELWQSDGTAGGTTQVVDLHTGNGTPRELTVFDGRLFFVGTSNADGREVFVVAPAPPVPVPALPVAGRWLLVAMIGGISLLTIAAAASWEDRKYKRDSARGASASGVL